MAIAGGAGRQCLATIYDLLEYDSIESILLIDIDDKALVSRKMFLGSEKINIMAADLTNIGKIAEALRDCDVILNASMHTHNMDVMAACIESKTNYTDLGGFYQWVGQQLNRHDDFKKAGITGITGSGSAPGITNVMAKYAVDRLDSVETIQILDAIFNPDAKDEFLPPYQLSTIIDQSTMNNYEYINGTMVELPPYSGEIEYAFEPPYGTVNMYNIVNSEVATMPISFKNKGIKNISFKYTMPQAFENQIRCLIKSGMGSKKKIKIDGHMISPRDVLISVCRGPREEVSENYNDAKLLRVFVEGKKDGQNIRYELGVDLNHHPWNLSNWVFSVGFPAAITMRMLGNGSIREKGVFSSESIIDTKIYFEELAKRDVFVKCNVLKQV